MTDQANEYAHAISEQIGPGSVSGLNIERACSA